MEGAALTWSSRPVVDCACARSVRHDRCGLEMQEANRKEKGGAFINRTHHKIPCPNLIRYNPTLWKRSYGLTVVVWG
jgi:hypothetical protein